MSVTGYTTIYNEVLRDRTLSLEAKGLFSVIKSFVGLPDFALSKRRLGYACSDSAYLLNAAWKELKQKGYLQHYFSQSENGAFCHVYNLMQHPSEPVDYVYSPSIDRPNGDVACISGAQRDYTLPLMRMASRRCILSAIIRSRSMYPWYLISTSAASITSSLRSVIWSSMALKAGMWPAIFSMVICGPKGLFAAALQRKSRRFFYQT